MKKNYIYKVMFVSALLAVSVSCKKPLDVEPKDEIGQEFALNTSKDVEAALVGAYSDLGDEKFYGGLPFIFSEFLANTNAIRWTGTYEELTQPYNQAVLKTNSYVEDVWKFGYSAVNDVNNVLSAIDKVDEAKKARVEGEAKFIRGAVHFELVRLFAKAYNDGSASTNLGVPIVLTPTTVVDEASYVSRATVAAVYQQVIKDLTEAEALLPETNGFFAAKYTAAAMLAKVYLQMGDYTSAAAAADRVISSGVYTLASTYSGAFPVKQEPGRSATPGPNTPEDIFAMQVNTLTGYNDFNQFFASSGYGGRGDAAIQTAWIDANYVDGDDRKNSFYVGGARTFSSKFANQYGNVPVIRFAEIYLIRAEANVRLGTSVGAAPIDDLAMIRTRAGLTTTSATLADILKERRLELAFEGAALHDAKRTATNVGTIAWNDNRLVLPIPQREIDANNKLIQNPGYLAQ